MPLRFAFIVCFIFSFINRQASAQNKVQSEETTLQQLLGCWRNVAEPSSQVCFEASGRLLFKNAEADKTIRRKWKILPNGLVRIKFIFLFRPKYRIHNLTKQYLKLVPVNKGIVIELER